MQIPQGIDAIFVIHAACLAERRKLIEAQLSARRMAHEFIADYDAEAIPAGIRDSMIRGAGLSAGQQSCALKHWHAHVLADERNYERVLVLEDDVVLAPDFSARLCEVLQEDAAIEAPHVSFLGCGGHYYVAKSELEPGRMLYRRDQGRFADSYIVNRGAIALRLWWLAQNGIAHPIDHQFEIADRATGTAMYWLEPPITEQGSHNGRFASTLSRSHPLWFQAAQFRWKKLWRRRGRA
jgi:glycosyl transferase family 25